VLSTERSDKNHFAEEKVYQILTVARKLRGARLLLDLNASIAERELQRDITRKVP
jgi:hypothetical protein